MTPRGRAPTRRSPGLHVLRAGALLALLSLAAATGAAAAEADAKPARRVAPVSPGPPRPLWPGDPRPEGAGCVLGEPGPSVGNDFDYINPASGPDAYYTLLSRAGCPSCSIPDSAVVLDAAHVELAFPVPCPQPVTLSIVAAGGTPSCRTPDTTQVIAGPFATNITPNIGGLYTFHFPLPGGIRLEADAFLCVKFLAFPSECAAPDNPRLRISGSCGLCQVYNDYYSAGIGGIRRVDLCGIGVSGRPVMSVSATECVVPVLPRSWGALKHRYR